MATNNNLQDFLTDIANAIRTKTQTTEPINAQNFSTEILNIQTGGGENTLKNLLDATKSCYYLFYNYKGTSVDGLIQPDDTANVTNMQYMFRNCPNLTTIPALNTSNATMMLGLLYQCPNITSIPLLDTSKVNSMKDMFNGCENLTTVPLLNTGNVRDMSMMFQNCTKLTTLPALNTSKVTTMNYMFNNCINLTEIPAFDVSNVTNFSDAFTNCSSLTAIHMSGMKKSFNISYSTQFTTEALHEIIDNLATTSNQKLTMGSTNLAKVSSEYRTIATNKGWTLK